MLPDIAELQAAFVRYLVSQSVINAEQRAAFQRARPQPSELFGELAERHQLLAGDEIALVLEEQSRGCGVFGQIAEELGYLDQDCVERLAYVHLFRRFAEVLETLILHTDCEPRLLLRHMLMFLLGATQPRRAPRPEGETASASQAT